MVSNSVFLIGVVIGIILHTMYDWYLNNKK